MKTLLAILLVLVTAQAADTYAGKPLGDVLRDLQRRGLNVVFSSELVKPDMKVATAPKATTTRGILDEVLEPHGLAVKSGPRESLIVVRDAGRPGAPTESRAQFKTSTRTVALYVTVTDSSGAPVRGLQLGDFQVEDDGRKPAITNFKSDIQPIAMAILLDRSPSLFPSAARAAQAVADFTRAMIPGDRATVGTFSQSVQLNAELSSQPAVLLEALHAATPWPAGTAIWDAIEAGRSALDAEGGKRVIMLVTDGADNASRADPNVVRTSLQKSGIIVYSVGIRGRVGLDTTEIGAVANSTGGRTLEIKSNDDIGAAMRQVADELHNQYVIGFTPEKLDDKLHRIVVKVRRPGAVARTTRMYFAGR